MQDSIMERGGNVMRICYGIHSLSHIVRALKLVISDFRKYFFTKLSLTVYATVNPLVAAWLAKEVIDIITLHVDSVWVKLIPVILAIATLETTNVTIKYFAEKSMVKMNEEIQLGINKQIIYKLSKVPVSFYDNVEAYNRIEAASREVTSFVQVLDNIFNLISAIFTIFFLVPIIASFDLLTICLVVGFNVPRVILQLKIKKFKYTISKESVHLNRCKNGVKNMLVNKYYAGEIRVFNLFEWLYAKYEMFSQKLVQVKQESVVHQGRLSLVNNVLSLVLSLIMQILFIIKVLSGIITIGGYTLYTNYIARFSNAVSGIINSIMNLYEKELFLRNLLDFIEDSSPNKDRKDNCNVPKLQECSNFRIDFINVSFAYNKESAIPVLDNVSFSIGEGKTLAIVGLNGAGKSTIINLLLRFYSPDTGEIRLNGINIEMIPIEEYYRLMTVVFQSPMLYPFSLKENIVFGDKSINQLEGRRWIEDIIARYPRGLETPILPYLDRSGVEPSRGETQRIALARAISKDSPILILDEPTSSMDPEIEYFMFKDFKEISRNKTCIVISHRLSSVTIADTIILINDGKIVESGSHKQLITLNGEYARLFRMQSEKYIQEQ